MEKKKNIMLLHNLAQSFYSSSCKKDPYQQEIPQNTEDEKKMTSF